MKANELMIGDWVMVSPWDETPWEPSKITDINFHSWEGTNFCDSVGVEVWDELSLDQIKPIPLTAEILEKNGFVKSIAGQYLLPAGGNEWIVTIIPNLISAPNSNGTMLIAIKNIYTDAKIAITYVHQLQHALKLCGIDKTIEL